MCDTSQERDSSVTKYDRCPITPDGVKRLWNKVDLIEKSVSGLTSQNALMLEMQAVRESLQTLSKEIGKFMQRVTQIEEWKDNQVDLIDKIKKQESTNIEVIQCKNKIWIDRFKIVVGAFLLSGIITASIFVPGYKELNLVNGLAFSIATFIFGESLFNKFTFKNTK